MAFRDLSIAPRLESFNLAVSWTQLWPLYIRLLRIDAVAHRLAVVCKLPLLHFGWSSAPRSPSSPAPGSQTLLPGSSVVSRGVAAYSTVDFDLSVPGAVRASLPCPLVDSRHGSMAACFGLQATPDSYCAAFAAFVRRISTPWLPSAYARLPHRFPRFRRIFPGFLHFPFARSSTLRFLGSDMSHSIAFSRFCWWSPSCWLGLPATPVPFQASDSAPRLPTRAPTRCSPASLSFSRFRFGSDCAPFPLAVPAAS